MGFAVVLMNAFPCQFNRHRAVLPVLWGKNLFSAFIREDNVHNEIVAVRQVLRFREMSAVDCGFKQVGLNGAGDSTSGQIVINSVTTTEEIQKLEVVSRSLSNLRKETSLRSLFSDEHGGLASDRSLPKLASNNPPPYDYGVSEEQQSDLPIAVGKVGDRRNVSQLLTIGDKWASHLSRAFPHRFSQHPVFLKAKNPLSQLY
jgi:hypothetical protein